MYLISPSWEINKINKSPLREGFISHISIYLSVKFQYELWKAWITRGILCHWNSTDALRKALFKVRNPDVTPYWIDNPEPSFPRGSVVQNQPANAGDMGSIPGPGRSHMPWSNKARVPQLLSLCYGAQEPQLLSPCAATTEARRPESPCSATREATAMRILCLATLQ